MMAKTWKLKRVRQCEKCPWKVDVDPYDIPDGYDVEKHRALKGTIAEPGAFRDTGRVMACHESAPEDGVHCVGWLVNQLGPGNNIGLRLRMMSCENAHAIQTDGEQHRCFEDTLPEDDRDFQLTGGLAL